MTLSFPRSLSFSFVISGSIHLGLASLLLLSVTQEVVQDPFVEISLMEKPIFLPETVRKATPISRSTVLKKKEILEERELSPSKEAIKKEEVVPNTSVSRVSTISVNPEDLYKSQITRELNARKSYPSLARRLKQQGRVIVQFSVNREGKVLEARVVGPSAFKTLNQSAKDLVEGLRQLNPFPKEIKKTTWLFQVPIDYQM